MKSRYWIDRGELPALHVGRRVRVRRADFDALLERSRTAPASADEQGQAQDFSEGELLPTPTVSPAEGE